MTRWYDVSALTTDRKRTKNRKFYLYVKREYEKKESSEIREMTRCFT